MFFLLFLFLLRRVLRDLRTTVSLPYDGDHEPQKTPCFFLLFFLLKRVLRDLRTTVSPPCDKDDEPRKTLAVRH